jgi:enoyl-CoA hydratase
MAQIRLEHPADRVALVTLDDPGRRNALSLELCADLTATMAALEADDGVGAVVVTGAGRAFCAGADLGQLGASREDGLRAIYDGFLAVAASPLATVAAVNGPAVGAGMNLALACDLRVVATGARFDCRFLDLGIHPGGGHTWMLRRIVGPQAAAAMVLFGEVLGAEAAVDRGLAWEQAAPDALVPRAVELASAAARAPRELSRAAKATLAEVAGIEAHDAAVEHELAKQLASMDAPAFAERLAALQARISAG